MGNICSTKKPNISWKFPEELKEEPLSIKNSKPEPNKSPWKSSI